MLLNLGLTNEMNHEIDIAAKHFHKGSSIQNVTLI